MSKERGTRGEERGAMDDGRGAGRPSRLDDGSLQGRFDLSIQLAVREMLDVEPAAGLRRRVMAQIPNSVGSAFRRNDLSRRKTLWTPLAAAAALVIAVMLWSRSTAPIPPPSLARAADRNLPTEPPRLQTVRSAPPKISAARIAAVRHR